MKRDEALKRFTETMRVMRYSGKTIVCYRDWAGQFISFLFTKPSGTREEQVGAFLTKIVVEKNISANTQKQALCAVLLFSRLVLKQDLGKIAFRPASRAKRPPIVLSREEAWRLLDRLNGTGWLWGAFMYGCGLRLDELCNLRVKDIDIDRRQVSVRDGKGGKDRIIPMPEMLVEPLQKHLRNIEQTHAEFSARRVPVWLPDALDKKYPNAPFSWEWFWLFPASRPIKNLSHDPRMHSATPKLFHVHHSAVQKRIHRAIKDARIPKKAHCHTLRHSFATHWLENAEGSHEIAIIRLQKLLGHSDPETTMIYLHCVKQKTDVPSPLDVRPALQLVRKAA